MRRARGGQVRGFVLLQSTVALIVAAILITVMLLRTRQYQDEAEIQSVKLTVNILRSALGLRITDARGQGQAGLIKIAEENPFDWLDRKPDNYLGEYYSPELKEMPVGNWVFDRRDKCLIYLLQSHTTFAARPSKFLKFKVEFAQARLPGVKSGPAEVSSGLVIEQIDDDTANKTD
jgi:general secretion pathway protein G